MVSLEDLYGDLDDLLNHPILVAEERSTSEDLLGLLPYEPESFTWTFYEFATVKGYVTLRWYGESNGYYSESVHFDKIEED